MTEVIGPLLYVYWESRAGPIFVWLRLKKKGRVGVQKERLWKQKKGQKLVKIVDEIRSTCLLEDNLVVSKLSVYDEHSWTKDMGVVMARLWDSLRVWPFISYDGEGNGIWSQLGFYSPGSKHSSLPPFVSTQRAPLQPKSKKANQMVFLVSQDCIVRRPNAL